jgi:AbiV family abortive infection protein
MQKQRKYHLTHDLLKEYQECSLLNSSELLVEATFLLSQKHYARAYFIGCASLEETGKGYLAFSARGRNLNSPNTQEAIKIKFEDHSAKLVSSLASFLQLKGLTDENIKEFLHLTYHLQRGREKAMYVDVRENGTISLPQKIVRPKAATDCVRLAQIALKTTLHFISLNKPAKTSSFADKLLCLSTNTITKIFNNEDFWWYYIDLLKKNRNTDLAVGVAKYHDEHYCKGKCFLNKDDKKS